MDVPGPDYAAFVSYRHGEPEGTWARWVLESVERWRTPRSLVKERGLPRRLGKVFLDTHELAAGRALGAELVRRLQASRHLVVVCTPATRGRYWIEEEVLQFQRWGRSEAILPLLVSGAPELSLPRALLPDGHASLGAEPIAADVREPSTERPRELRRRAALQLLAPMLGVDFDTLRQRDDRRRRQRLAAVLAVLTAVIGLLAGLTVWAWRAQSDASTAEREVTARVVALSEEQGRRAWLEGASGRALVSLAEAYERGGRSPALRFLLARASSMVGRSELVLAGHRRAVSASAFSPDGTHVVTADEDGVVRLWSSGSGALEHELSERGRAVRVVSFSPDGRYLLACAADLTVRVYEVATGRLTRQFSGGPDATPAAEWSFLLVPQYLPDGKRFLVVGGCRTRLLGDLSDGSSVRLPDPPPGQEAGPSCAYDWTCAVQRSGRLLATGDEMGWVRLYAVEGVRFLRTWQAHDAKVVALQFDPASGDLYSAGDEGSLARWPSGAFETEGGEPAPVWKQRAHAAGLSAFALAQTHAALATGSKDGQVRLWDVADGRQVRDIAAHASEVTAVAFDPAAEQVLSSSLDGTACLWSTGTGHRLATFEEHRGGIWSAGLAPDGRRLLTSSTDGTARLWSLTGLRPGIEVLHGSGSTLVACSDTLDRAVLAGRDGVVHLLDTASGARLADVALEGGQPVQALAVLGSRAVLADSRGRLYDWDLATLGSSPVPRASRPPRTHSLAILADGRLASGGEEGSLCIGGIEEEAASVVLQAPAWLGQLALSRNRRRLAIASADGQVWAWDIGDAAARRLHHEHRAEVPTLAMSGEGRYVLSAGRDNIGVIWDMQANRLVGVLRGHEQAVSGCAIDPQGRRAATSGWDGSMRLWTLATGALERVLESRDGHRGGTTLRFDATGDLLVSCGHDGTLRVWSSETGALLTVLEGHVGTIDSMDFTRSGEALLSADEHGGVRLWAFTSEQRSPQAVSAYVRAAVPSRLARESASPPR